MRILLLLLASTAVYGQQQATPDAALLTAQTEAVQETTAPTPLAEVPRLDEETVEFIEPAAIAELPPVFGINKPPSRTLTLIERTRLLEQVAKLAATVKAIHEEGSADAVKLLINQLVDDPDEREELAALLDVKTAVKPPTPPSTNPAPATPSVVPVIPVFAQVYSEVGQTEKAMISIAGRRFTMLPGETITLGDRRITLQSVSLNSAASPPEYEVKITDSGAEEILTWK